MKSLTTLVIAFFVLFESFGQRPMNKDFITSKLDSIIHESNHIYAIQKSKLTAEQLFKSNKVEIISYIKNDTINILFTDEHNHCFTKILFYNNYVNPLIIEDSVRQLNHYEDSVKKRQKLLINKVKKISTHINLSEDYQYSYIFINDKDQIKLYKITTTRLKNNIPFGNDFMYLFNPRNELINTFSFYGFKPKTIDPNTEIIILVYSPPTPFIFATDICKFRLYNSYGMTKFTAFSRRNKMNFTYNVQENKIEIHR